MTPANLGMYRGKWPQELSCDPWLEFHVVCWNPKAPAKTMLGKDYLMLSFRKICDKEHKILL